MAVPARSRTGRLSAGGSDRRRSSARGRRRRATEDVSRPSYGLDQRRVGGIGLHDRAQPVDVDVDRPRLAGVVVAPDLLEELVAADDLAGMAQQEGEEIEDLWLHGEDLAVA